MAVTFKEVLRYLENEKQIEANTRPTTLVHGGNKYPPDLRDRTKVNKQVILIVYEMTRGDQMIYNTIEDNIRRSLGLETRIGAFTFESKDEAEGILNELGTYFGQVLDPYQIIQRRTGHSEDPTVFILFLPIIEQYFYE